MIHPQASLYQMIQLYMVHHPLFQRYYRQVTGISHDKLAYTHIIVSTDEPIFKKKKRRSASEPDSSLHVSSTKPVPSKSIPDQVGPKKALEETITRKEMKQKKATLGEVKMEKKKGKVRETEKSARKGVKAQLVGKLKAWLLFTPGLCIQIGIGVYLLLKQRRELRTNIWHKH